jgi:hypothetical protein
MVINNRETATGEKCTYIDQAGQIFEGTLTSLAEQGGNCYADLEYVKDGSLARAAQVPHNTSPEKHSWNHSLV